MNKFFLIYFACALSKCLGSSVSHSTLNPHARPFFPGNQASRNIHYCPSPASQCIKPEAYVPYYYNAIPLEKHPNYYEAQQELLSIVGRRIRNDEFNLLNY